MTGLLFNIQKFCIHDGPGIRTVVFFKGCPLSCKWCSNPESQSLEIFYTGENKKADSRLYSLEETVEICLQDKIFYDESLGGVTLSGGEALFQPDFAAALMGALRKEGVHTALETSGFAPVEVFDKAAAEADLILFDIKHYDAQRHEEGTGFCNDLVIANLKNALSRESALGSCILARLPVIPGFNNSDKDALGFALMFKSLGIKKAQLLPFHQFGEKKYDMLGIDYRMRSARRLHKEDLEEFRRIIADNGIDCFF